jgi:ATP-dependent helicase/nuclease subunit A
MEWVALDQTSELTLLEQEAQRMERQGLLSGAEREALNLPALATFWHSDLGRRIRDHAPQVRREIPFTARLSLADLVRLNLPLLASPLPVAPSQGSVDLESEFMIVQGVVDLAVFLPHEIWLLDYKTDRVSVQELEGKVKAYQPQIALYALALNRIVKLPVTQRWLHFLTLGQTVPVDFADIPD